MSDLTAKFEALETQLTTQNEALLLGMGDIADILGLINTALDTLNNNNATNTKYLLAAIGANSPCSPCPTPSLTIPPVGTTPSGINADKCKRVQAFLQFMTQVFTVLDVASAVGVGFSPVLISDAYNQVIAGLSGGDSPDAISWPEAIQLVGDLISYVATNLTVGDTLVGVFSPLVLTLRDAMALTTDAAGAKAAYDSVIIGSGVGSWEKPVLRDAAYGAAYTYFFDPASDPNLSGFDGSVCGGTMHGITGCTDFDAVPLSSGGHDYYYIQTPPEMGPLGLFTGGDFYGYSFQLIDGTSGRGVDVYYTTDGTDINFGQGHGVGEGPIVLAQHTTGIIIQTHDDDELAFPFTMRVCPPE